jgi:hypothetical protein
LRQPGVPCKRVHHPVRAILTFTQCLDLPASYGLSRCFETRPSAAEKANPRAAPTRGRGVGAAIPMPAPSRVGTDQAAPGAVVPIWSAQERRSFGRSQQKPVSLQHPRNKSAFPCLLARSTSQYCLPVQCGTPLHATDLVVFRKLGRSHYFPLFENSLGRSLKKQAPPAQNETSSGGPIPSEQSLASNLPS